MGRHQVIRWSFNGMRNICRTYTECARSGRTSATEIIADCGSWQNNVQSADQSVGNWLKRRSMLSYAVERHNMLSDASNIADAKAFSSQAAPALSQTAAIRELREKTGAPMKDVKSVLVECGWDLESAFTTLRKKGLAAASKKASRVAAEGLLGVASSGRGLAAIVEINSETDFVGRNDLFRHVVELAAKAAVNVDETQLTPSPDGAQIVPLQALEGLVIKVNHAKLQGEMTIGEAVRGVAAITGENVQLRRAISLHSNSGVIMSYLHTSPQPGLSRIAALVALELESGAIPDPVPEAISTLGSDLAMHVVAAAPQFLSRALVTKEALDHERGILLSQAASSGKPEAVVQKMVEGRLRKYYEENVLLEQKYVADDSISIQEVLKRASKELGSAVRVSGFARFACGQGIDRGQKDFAAEVEAQLRTGS